LSARGARRVLPAHDSPVTLPRVELQRSVNGALAGAVAAAVWAAQQPLDKRVFHSSYDDVELLGKAVTRESSWPLAGIALHLQAGAVFGAIYAQLRPFLPAPPLAGGLIAGLTEHVGLWPLGGLIDRYHPARRELTPLSGNRRAFAQAAWRHAIFGLVMGELERRLNARDEYEPPRVPVASDGRGNIEAAVGAA
jgi:xanthosine utilization system XapX-like protein